MRNGVEQVQNIIGNDVPNVTEKEIREALWHYYYDVDKSVTWILSVSLHIHPKEFA